MEALKLTKEVVIRGKDFWGRDAWIKIYPCDFDGWWWKHDKMKQPVAINSDLAKKNFRRLILSHEGSVLDCFEHIGALYWTGLTRIVIETSGSVPFFGRPLDIWGAIKPYTKEFGSFKIPWLSFEKTIRGEKSPGSMAYTKISGIGNGHEGLEIEIIIHYPNLGGHEFKFSLPASLEELEDIFSARTLGWPYWLHAPAALSAKLFNWPHLERVIWPHKNEENILKQISKHRMADLLGALSLVKGSRLLSGEIISYMSGHEEDLDLVKKITDIQKSKNYKAT